MRLGIDRYRSLQAELDVVGITTQIVTHGSKCYQFIANMKVVKQYRNRSSCNAYLVKLHAEHIKSCWDILGIKETKVVKRINEAYIARCEYLMNKSGDNTLAFCELTNARRKAYNEAKGIV